MSVGDGFWILDFGFWISLIQDPHLKEKKPQPFWPSRLFRFLDLHQVNNPKSKIQNLKSPRPVAGPRRCPWRARRPGSV
ncbi:MAG: hypothetical protein ACE10K_01965, partial [Rhodothermales bacterium]